MYKYIFRLEDKTARKIPHGKYTPKKVFQALNDRIYLDSNVVCSLTYIMWDNFQFSISTMVNVLNYAIKFISDSKTFKQIPTNAYSFLLEWVLNSSKQSTPVSA